MSSIPKLLKIKDYITLTGTTLGLIAIVLACMGTRFFYSFGFFLITITIGTDMLDGYVARKTNTQNEIGKELDSLNDSLTFGIAPGIILFQAFKTGGLFDIVLLIGCIIYALAAILRLARFNISDVVGYTGVPTPLSCLLVICIFYANHFYTFAIEGGGEAGMAHPFPEISYYTLPFLLIFIGFCNITTHLSFGKDKNVYYVFMPCAVLEIVLAIIGISNPSYIISMAIAIFFIAMVILIFAYIIYGFFIGAKVKKKFVPKEKKE